MTELKRRSNRGGSRPGAGRKRKTPDSEPMRNRAMRWTDAGWADVLAIGLDRVRELVRRDAIKQKRKAGKA